MERRIGRLDLGDDWWPFTVESGTLGCDRGAVTFEVDGIVYALNGTARTMILGADIAPIWADAETLHCGLKKNIAPLVSLGLELC